MVRRLTPAGEQDLVPDIPVQRLVAAMAPALVAPAPDPAAPAAGTTVAATDPASIIARHEPGGDLRAAARDAADGMRTRQPEHAATAVEERRRSQEQVTQLIRESATRQGERRASARR